MHSAHMALEIGIILVTGIARGEKKTKRWHGERFTLECWYIEKAYYKLRYLKSFINIAHYKSKVKYLALSSP